MNKLAKIVVVEMKLFLREPGGWLVSVLLPTAILAVLGAILTFGPIDPDMGPDSPRFIDLFVPSLVVMSLGILAMQMLPSRLVSYREKGVLRRLSTAPVQPAMLLIAQMVINVAAAVVALALLIVVGNLAFQIRLPQHPLGFGAAFVFGMSSLFALGLMVAAVAPSGRLVGAISVPLYMAVMFLGGVYFPRMLLPEFLIRLGDYTPPGVQALLDAWVGGGPEPLQLIVMAAITVAAGAAAAKLFRWE